MSSDPAIGDQPLELRLDSTAEQVATVLRELIIAGRLAPGMHVREGPIAAQLGVSRNALREAINILVGQGLMRREIHRGAYVSELGADDIRDLYAVRRLVEVAAVRELAATHGDLGCLAEAVDALDGAAASGDVRRFLDADLNCHHVLVELKHQCVGAVLTQFAPDDLGPAINRPDRNESRPSLSWDGETLYFGRAVPGQAADIYVSTRRRTHGSER